MTVERLVGRGRRGDVTAVVAWLAVLGVVVALGFAGRQSDGRSTAMPSPPTAAQPSTPAVVDGPLRSPLTTRPPIGEDGVMGGLPFGTAFEWLESD
jgi:hypothetical protein